MVLDWGPYRGKSLSEVPVEYLRNLTKRCMRTVSLLDARGDDMLGYGIHAETPIRELPEEYWQWLWDHNQETIAALESEMQRRMEADRRAEEERARREREWARAEEEAQRKREERRERRQRKKTTQALHVILDGDWAEAIVQAGFRALSLKHHPDHGGTNDQMRALMQARDTLLTLTRDYHVQPVP